MILRPSSSICRPKEKELRLSTKIPRKPFICKPVLIKGHATHRIKELERVKRILR